MQTEVLDQLKNDIHNKCVAYDYNDATDTTLSDFVLNLLLVDKSPQEVTNEMILLVGNDYDANLTNWIFERKHQLENPQAAAAPVEQQQQQAQVEQTQEESMDVTPRVAKPERENRMFSKAIGSVIGHVNRPETSSQPRRHERSRSRSPVRSSSRHETDRYASRHEDRSSSRRDDHRSSRHDDDRNRSGNIFSRLGNSANSSSRREDDRPSVFDRLGGSKPISTSPTTQNNQDSKSERCKYWPNCKNGDNCIYVHPTTVCPDFPNCPKKAIECLYIHPEVAKPVIMPQVRKVPAPCKFFPYCTNPLCPFIHPVVPQQKPFFMQGSPSFATTGQRVQIPCKHGDACTRPDCHFVHPKDTPNPQSEVICKFDGACTRPGCFYKHTKENSANKVFVNPEASTYSRQFSVAEDEVVERVPVGESADIIITSQEQLHQEQSSSMDMDSDVVMDAN